MADPLIGITTYPPTPENRFELPEPYVACVRRAGAQVVLLPPATRAEFVDYRALLDRLDGIVLAGGGDLDPALYDGATHETVYAIDPARDADEIALVHLVLERTVPTLAICRGTQVVNVALGGSLVTHLPDVLPADAPLHRIEPEVLRGMPSPTPHAVEVEAGSLLAKVMGETAVTPMSWHHQSVDRPGDGLRVVARAPDGVVEGLEHDSHPWLACVQWHPELTAAEDATQQRLFDGLIEAAEGGVR